MRNKTSAAMRTSEGELRCSDRADWVIDRAQQQATNNYRDYAIVTRFTDTNTGKIAIVAAGVGRDVTIAAGEFLTDPADLAQVVNAARASETKNMEFVLSTEIIDGQPGTRRWKPPTSGSRNCWPA